MHDIIAHIGSAQTHTHTHTQTHTHTYTHHVCAHAHIHRISSVLQCETYRRGANTSKETHTDFMLCAFSVR